MKLRAFNIDTDFVIMKNWITDERTHMMWCAGQLPFPMTRPAFEDFLARISANGDRPYVAIPDDSDCPYGTVTSDEKPLGFFARSLNTETNESMLKFIVVDPEARGKGVARKMLRLAIADAFENDHADAVHLNVFSTNPRARKCYEKVGFTERETTAGPFTYKDESWGRHNMVIRRDDFQKMTIRKALCSDLPALRDLYLALEEDGVRYQPEHFVIGERTDEFFQSIFDSDTQDILVADIGGEAVGFVHVMIIPQKKVSCLKPQSVVYMQDLCVRQDMRNGGIGSKLVRAAKDYGKEKGVDFIRTQVFPGNVDGMRFYERNGFCEMMKTIECQRLD